MKKMGTKKVVLVGVVTIFLLGSGIGYKVYADSVRQEKIATELAVAKDQLKQLLTICHSSEVTLL